MTSTVRDLLGDESGGALVEYALVTALVSVVGYGVFYAFGDVLTAYFSDTATTLAQTAVIAQ